MVKKHCCLPEILKFANGEGWQFCKCGKRYLPTDVRKPMQSEKLDLKGPGPSDVRR